MKSIIEGRRYDTEAPRTRLIGETTGGSPYTTDFSHWSAGLYVTGKGSYFLAGKGGPMTAFSKRCSDSTWTGGEKVIPLTSEDAYKWAEENLKPEQLESEFPELIQEA